MSDSTSEAVNIIKRTIANPNPAKPSTCEHWLKITNTIKVAIGKIAAAIAQIGRQGAFLIYPFSNAAADQRAIARSVPRLVGSLHFTKIRSVITTNTTHEVTINTPMPTSRA